MFLQKMDNQTGSQSGKRNSDSKQSANVQASKPNQVRTYAQNL